MHFLYRAVFSAFLAMTLDNILTVVMASNPSSFHQAEDKGQLRNESKWKASVPFLRDPRKQLLTNGNKGIQDIHRRSHANFIPGLIASFHNSPSFPISSNIVPRDSPPSPSPPSKPNFPKPSPAPSCIEYGAHYLVVPDISGRPVPFSPSLCTEQPTKTSPATVKRDIFSVLIAPFRFIIDSVTFPIKAAYWLFTLPVRIILWPFQPIIKVVNWFVTLPLSIIFWLVVTPFNVVKDILLFLFNVAVWALGNLANVSFNGITFPFRVAFDWVSKLVQYVFSLITAPFRAIYRIITLPFCPVLKFLCP